MTTEIESVLANLRITKVETWGTPLGDFEYSAITAEMPIEIFERYEAAIRELAKGVDFNTDHPDWRVHSHPRLAITRALQILKGETHES